MWLSRCSGENKFESPVCTWISGPLRHIPVYTCVHHVSPSCPAVHLCSHFVLPTLPIPQFKNLKPVTHLYYFLALQFFCLLVWCHHNNHHVLLCPCRTHKDALNELHTPGLRTCISKWGQCSRADTVSHLSGGSDNNMQHVQHVTRRYVRRSCFQGLLFTYLTYIRK